MRPRAFEIAHLHGGGRQDHPTAFCEICIAQQKFQKNHASREISRGGLLNLMQLYEMSEISCAKCGIELGRRAGSL